jgi:fructose-1,6-bisphosphatase I
VTFRVACICVQLMVQLQLPEQKMTANGQYMLHQRLIRGSPYSQPRCVGFPKRRCLMCHATTIRQFLTSKHTEPALIDLISSIEACGIEIAKLAAAGGADLGLIISETGDHGERDAQKKLDVVSNEIFIAKLKETGLVRTLASEELDDPVSLDAQGRYSVVFDPLDGSRNIEVSIPTGSIFGIYPCTSGSPLDDVLQPGRDLVAAGYILYSSACLLVLTTGSGTHGFTLTPKGGFVLSHPDMNCPDRGQIYSLNDARFDDWPAGLQKYIAAIRNGKGISGKQYSSRYVCALVADAHRTLLLGGWAANPREHLRLVFEANPMAFLTEQARGKASDGKQRIMDLKPSKLHHRLPFFLGSKLDIDELESYADVQQLSEKKYTV